MKYRTNNMKYFVWLLIIPFTMGCFLTRIARSFLLDTTPTTPPVAIVDKPTPEPVLVPTIEEAVPAPTQEVVQNGGASHEPICTQVDELKICAPYGLVDSLVVSTIPEITSEEGAPWEISPKHYQIDFQGYPLQDTFWKPKMEIYPLERYQSLAPDMVGPHLENLNSIVESKAEHISSVTMLPFVNAGALFTARPMYFDEEFYTVRGYSVLTQFGQSFWPINNKDMFYTFQGVTSDGKYWISLVLPVTQQDLPPNGEYITNQDFEAFANGFQEYANKTTAQLEAVDEYTFTPDLTSFEMVISYSFTQY